MKLNCTRNTILTLIILALAVFFDGCFKDKIIKDKNQKYKGRLIYQCGKPAANIEIDFYHPPIMETWERSNDSWEEPCITDANGYFTFINKHKYHPNSILFRGNIIRDNLTNYPTNNRVGWIKIPGIDINFIRKLQVNNPHSAADTLYLIDFQNDTIRLSKGSMIAIPGPFHDMTIDTVFNRLYNSGNVGDSVNVTYQYYESWQANQKIPLSHSFKVPSCADNSFGESVIQIN